MHVYIEAEVKREEAASLPRGRRRPGRGEKARLVEGRRRVPGQERMELQTGAQRYVSTLLPGFLFGCLPQYAGPRV
jgi:hypothetical protein